MSEYYVKSMTNLSITATEADLILNDISGQNPAPLRVPHFQRSQSGGLGIGCP
jgi:hypothetical protein